MPVVRSFLQSSVQEISLQTTLSGGIGRYLKNTNRASISLLGGLGWQNVGYTQNLAQQGTQNIAVGFVVYRGQSLQIQEDESGCLGISASGNHRRRTCPLQYERRLLPKDIWRSLVELLFLWKLGQSPSANISKAATTVRAQDLAGPSAIGRSTSRVGRLSQPSFLLLLELPSDLRGELAEHIDQAANPCLGQCALISLDQIIRVSWLPRSRDHSSPEGSDVRHELWSQVLLAPVVGHKVSHDRMTSAWPESVTLASVVPRLPSRPLHFPMT